MNIEEKKVGKVNVVRLAEKRLDMRSAPGLRNKLADTISAGGSLLLVDLSIVDFIDSSGLGALVASLKKLDGHGDLAVCGLQAPVRMMFQLTRLDRVFRIFNDEREAISTLS